MNSTGANSTTHSRRDELETMLAEDVLSVAKVDRQGMCDWLGISRRQAKTIVSGGWGPKRNEPRDLIMALLSAEGATVGEIADLA